MEFMNKYTPEQGSSILSDIEKITYEPTLVEARRAATEYNEILDSSDDIEGDDLVEVIQQLDRQVGEFMGESAVVSGRFRYIDVDGRYVQHYLEEALVEFGGFALAPEDFDEESPESELSEKRIFYYVRLNAQNEGVNGGDSAGWVGSVVGLDSIVDFRAVSPERAESWLSYSYPDLIEDIDRRILNSEDGDEADVVTNLSDFTVSWSDYESEEEATMVAGSVQAYINKILPFDFRVPYSSVINGEFYLIENGDQFTKLETSPSHSDAKLYTFRELNLLPVDLEQPNVDELGLYVTMEYMEPNYSKDNAVLVVPVSSIKSARSVRRAYYS